MTLTAWHLFNPRSRGICAQGILPARPACVSSFSRHPLNRQGSTEQSAPCNPALSRSSVIRSLTLDRGFQTPSAFRVSAPCVPRVKGMPTSRMAIGGHLCHIGLSLVYYFHNQQVEIWKMELNVISSAVKWVVDQVSWPATRFRASFNSKKCVKLDWKEISSIFFFFKIWFTLLPVLFIEWGPLDSEGIGDMMVIQRHTACDSCEALFKFSLLYYLISEFRLLNTVFVEYSVGKSLRDSSSQGTEYEWKWREEEDRESEKQRGELLSGTMLP